jgi:predicted aspartyl protease
MKPIIPRLLARLAAAAACAMSLQAQAAPAPAKCTFSRVAKLPLRYTSPSLMITTAGSINGTPAELLVDTGAYQTFFTRTGTERRNMPLRRTGQFAFGIGGSTPIFETRYTDFSAGFARAPKGFMPVLGDFGFTPSFDGLLGSTFLLQADLEISLASKEITFFHTEHCADTYLGYWGDNVIDIPFKPHDELGLNPHFTVRVNGKEMEAIIDTGAATSSILRDAAKAAGIAVDLPGLASHHSAGAGARKAASWVVSARTFQIGSETVQNAELAVIDARYHDVDVILGADFLRAHRVLFAMSQQRLYFSYVGGEPFGQRRKLEPWIQAEADAGNADAQFVLSEAYRRGKLVPRDDTLAASWLEKAALGGSPYALLSSGGALMQRGDAAAAAIRLRAALDQLPAERQGALWLYLARVRTGQPELARQELAATFARSESDEWPKPIADFYLGKLTLEKLLAQAPADSAKGRKRHCQTVASVAVWLLAHGQPDQVKALAAGSAAVCDSGEQAQDTD